MRSPDTPAGDEIRDRQRTTRPPLYVRMYFNPAYTDLVRLVGYGGLPLLPDARKKIQLLVEKFGEEKLREAEQALIEYDTSREPGVARLTAQARKLAFQLLGPPPESYVTKTGEKLTSRSETNEEKREPEGEERTPDAQVYSAMDAGVPGKNVRLPRRELVDRYLQWLQREKLTFLVAHEAQQRIGGQARLGTLDFVVHQDCRKLLVTVRSSLRAKERADMLGWQEAFGSDYAAVRVWPVEGKDGCNWRQYAIAPDSEGASAEDEPSGGSQVASLMEQYREAKERHPGMLLLFRIGDFYELFNEDAETAAKLLGLTLTTRGRTISMAGFPHHCLESHLRKLLRAGHRVAMCEQVTETLPRANRREVTRVVTPGRIAVEGPAPPNPGIPSQESLSPDESTAPDSPSTPTPSRPHAPARKQAIARKRQRKT